MVGRFRSIADMNRSGLTMPLPRGIWRLELSRSAGVHAVDSAITNCALTLARLLNAWTEQECHTYFHTIRKARELSKVVKVLNQLLADPVHGHEAACALCRLGFWVDVDFEIRKTTPISDDSTRATSPATGHVPTASPQKSEEAGGKTGMLIRLDPMFAV